MMRRRYFGRISGPLLDRVDIQLQVERVSLADFGHAGEEEDTRIVAERVLAARERQLERLLAMGLETNSQVPGGEPCGVNCGCLPGPPGFWTLRWNGGTLTARGYDRVLRLAWTLADLAHSDTPDMDHIGQALGLRQAAAAT